MIQYKPLKRSPALVQFSKDHHFALLLIWKIRQGLAFGINTNRINKYINFFFKNYLETHFKEEEELLFVHLDKNNELRLTAEEDHFALRAFAEKLNLRANSTTIREFANRLETHIRFEERGLFNKLQSTLTEVELNFVCNKMAAPHHNIIPDEWKDEFWIKSKV